MITVAEPLHQPQAAPQAVQAEPVELKTLGWALRRAALGLAIILVGTGFFAWLLYASIDEPEGTARGPDAQSVYALPPG